MNIELLREDGSIFTRINGVIDAQKEFHQVYKPMYRGEVAAWREVPEPTPAEAAVANRVARLAALDNEYEPQIQSMAIAYALAAMAAEDPAEAAADQADVAEQLRELLAEKAQKRSAIIHGNE